jgi:glycosyltransferase involved in cell wall biosynthesis
MPGDCASVRRYIHEQSPSDTFAPLNLPPADARRLVILPSYNSGPQLVRTACAALEHWHTVWVVLDGSTDESVAEIQMLAAEHPGLRVFALAENQGKGGATLHAMRVALAAGFSHALVMDADGQHPADAIRPFMELSQKNPGAMILGAPVFGADAPAERVKGRRVGNWFTNLETLWGGVQDSLFGFRLYPLAESVRIMEAITTARRFDFDTELVVRLFWAGVQPINRPVPVTYPPDEKGGVTHFKYVRDNLLLVGTHTRLCLLLFPRLVRVWNLRQKWRQVTSS